jgi:hypothetical protein
MATIKKYWKVLRAVAVASCVIFVLYVASQTKKKDSRGGKAAPNGSRSRAESAGDAEPEQRIAANRLPGDRDGFRGPVHPLLFGSTRLTVKAIWCPPAGRPHKLEQNAPELVNTLLHAARPALTDQIYTEQELSGFMPDGIKRLGQVWTLEPTRVAVFLQQLHPSASLALQAMGRQAGPDGAFGILRAFSPEFLDIVCRIHAEFNLSLGSSPADLSPGTLRYTPAYFLGRLLVNRKAGTIDYFCLDVPTDKPLNVHLTGIIPPLGDLHDIVFVSQLRLEGGNRKLLDEVKWDHAIDLAQAKSALAHRFYKFNDIHWLPIGDVLAQAQERKKPVLAVVTWGPFDDQSC